MKTRTITSQLMLDAITRFRALRHISTSALADALEENLEAFDENFGNADKKDPTEVAFMECFHSRLLLAEIQRDAAALTKLVTDAIHQGSQHLKIVKSTPKIKKKKPVKLKKTKKR